MAQADLGLIHNHVTLCATGLTLLVFLPLKTMSAETEIIPEIETSFYGYEIKDQQVSADQDKGLAAQVLPSLKINITGKQAASALYVQNESIWYDDSQRDNKSQTSYNWLGTVSAYQERVVFGLNAQSQYRLRNTEFGVFSDTITGRGSLSKTDSYGANLGFSTLRSADIQASLQLSHNTLQSDAPEQDDGFGNFTNDTQQAQLSLASADRHSTLFWQLSADYRTTQRESSGDYVSKRTSATAGVPLFPALAAIVRGSYVNDDNSARYNSEFKSYGFGLEYQFGRASRINISQNYSTSGNGEQTGTDRDDSYVATEIYLVPSRRTSLAFTSDRSNLGRTTSISGEYNLRTISARLSVTETVQTLSTFDLLFQDLGIFVCPNGSQQISDCVKPPTNNYQLGTGESFRRLFEPELELNEEIIKRRSAALSLGYSKNRLKLSVSLNKSEDEYLESDKLYDRKTAAMQASWQLSKHSTLLLNGRYYEINYQDESRQDTNISIETGVKRTLNDDADVSIMLRRIERNSNQDEFDLEENRVWLSYKHRF
jgi:uncharacterized protein (PEP-CTERM system associated)